MSIGRKFLFLILLSLIGVLTVGGLGVFEMRRMDGEVVTINEQVMPSIQLAQKLEKDFDGLRREAAEPLPGDWRSYTIPLMDANGPKPIKLHVHPLKEDDENGGKERSRPGSRFVIDLDLSRFGPMQLDGLVRPNHFDLILRSHAALPPELRVELIQVFADSVRAVGYSGGLSFQSGARSWVKLTRAGQAGLGVSA